MKEGLPYILETIDYMNQDIKHLFSYFNRLGIKEGDLVLLVNEEGKTLRGFFTHIGLSYSNYSQKIKLFGYVKDVKKDGTPSKISHCIMNPINIVKL